MGGGVTPLTTKQKNKTENMNHFGSRWKGEGADLRGPTTNKINKFKNKIWLTKPPLPKFLNK